MEIRLSFKKNLPESSFRTLFERVAREHYSRVYLLVLRLSKDKEMALDITQEALLKTFEYLEDKQELDGDKIAGFLMQVAKNMYMDIFRRKRRAQDYEIFSLQSDSCCEEPGVDYTVDGEGRKMDDFREEEAQLYFFKMKERLTFDEISSVVEIPLSTLISRFRVLLLRPAFTNFALE